MNGKVLEEKLLKAYDEIAKRKGKFPEWAFDVHNTIPFVGRNYCESKPKILVYASAENLSLKSYGDLSKLRTEEAKNRHRNYFENSSDFFPKVHISPMNNGQLATAILYLARCLGMDIKENITPREFYETIAFANYAKYSIKGDNGTNIDYTTIAKKSRDDAQRKLDESIPFIEKDIEILQPDFIILPEGIYNINRKSFDKIKKNATLIKIYQVNSRVIHCTVKRLYKQRDVSSDITLKNWIDKISEVNTDLYSGIFDHLDDRLSKSGVLWTK